MCYLIVVDVRVSFCADRCPSVHETDINVERTALHRPRTGHYRRNCSTSTRHLRACPRCPGSNARVRKGQSGKCHRRRAMISRHPLKTALKSLNVLKTEPVRGPFSPRLMIILVVVRSVSSRFLRGLGRLYQKVDNFAESQETSRISPVVNFRRPGPGL